jgi:hypothetical protein
MHDEVDLAKTQKFRQLFLNVLNALFYRRKLDVLHSKVHLEAPQHAFFATQEVVIENL